LQFKGFDVSMRRRLSRYVFCSSTPRLAEWLDDVVAEVFVDDGGVDVGDLRSFGEPVDHDGVEGIGVGYGAVEVLLGGVSAG
jgi:hypothetical protein